MTLGPTLGPCLHHLGTQEGDAGHVREGEQKEGAHQGPGHHLREDPKRTPDLTWRLPRAQENAGVWWGGLWCVILLIDFCGLGGVIVFSECKGLSVQWFVMVFIISSHNYFL